MRTIRRGVFETNSSSTHSISIVSKAEFDKWGDGELLFERYGEKFYTQEEAIQKLKDSGYYKDLDFSDEDAVNEAFTDSDLVTYDEFMDDEHLETFVNSYTTKSGDTVVAFGRYGYDG